MGVIEIILGVVLLAASAIVILSVTMQESKGGLGSLYGGSNDSFFDKNMGRTKEAALARASTFAGACLFIVTILLGAIANR